MTFLGVQECNSFGYKAATKTPAIQEIVDGMRVELTGFVPARKFAISLLSTVVCTIQSWLFRTNSNGRSFSCGETGQSPNLYPPSYWAQ